MKVKPQRRTASSNRSGRGGASASRPLGRRPVKKKKQDNTKLFIGIGVGAFFFLFIIIAAATSGGGSQQSQGYSSSSKEKAYSLPVSARKTIYRQFTKVDDKLQDDFQDSLASLSMEEARKQGASLKSKKDRASYNAKVELRKKLKSKYPGLTKSYFDKIINEGIDKNW